MTQQIGHWIDGKPHAGVGPDTAPVYDPATGAMSAWVRLASIEDVDAAVQSAKAAWPAWRDTSVPRRAAVLFQFRQLLEEHADRLAKAISDQHGKTHDDALGEVRRGLEVVEFACGAGHLLKGSVSEEVARNVDTTTFRQPLGVVAGITPFNFPAMVPMWMFPVALAAGNAFVLKPSERDPAASLIIAELLDEAGLPPGVFNVVQGDRPAVERLIKHPDVAAISFVGSTPVARAVYAGAAANGKRVQALGGAKNHLVVLPDADVDAAADAIVSAAYGSAGERCMAISVVVAVGTAADPVVEAVRERASRLRVGPATDETSEMGPLITAAHRDRVSGYLEDERVAGADVVLDGRRHTLPSGDGFWLGPTLVDHVDTSTPVYQDEIFGPVLAVVRVPDLHAALELINRGPYGNGVSIFTADGAAARTFQREVEVGMVGVNVPIPVPVAFHSFGGWKDSLFGDLHIYGPDAVNFYTRSKVVTTRWKHEEGVTLAFPGTDS